MLPGVLAGQYSSEQMQIDLVRLCRDAGAELVIGEVACLDSAKRKIGLANGTWVPFDVLSIGVGSVPSFTGVATWDQTVVTIKPMQTFLERFDKRLVAARNSRVGGAVRLAVVGAGAAGVEIALCLPARVRQVLGDVLLELTLVDGHSQLLRGMPVRTEQFIQRELKQRGVRVLLQRRVVGAAKKALKFDEGPALAADVVLWATSAAAPPLLGKLGLPTDEHGFLLTRPTLQSLADPAIFVVGDSGTLIDHPAPKAGVFAVRQAPVLWSNLARIRRGRPLRTFRPQRGFLKLLNLGNGQALAEYRGLTAVGRWCWKLKDAIDRRFMAQFLTSDNHQ